MTAKDHIELLRGLRAVRRFRADPVPDAVVDDILEVARWSGSSSNRQPWELIVVHSQDTLRALAAADDSPGLPVLPGSPLAIMVVLASQSVELDGGRLIERMLLAASAHGVGATIAGIRGGGTAAAKELLGIPEERVLRAAVCMGYPATASARLVSVERDIDDRVPISKISVGRKPLSEFVYDERYGQAETAGDS